MWVAIVGVRLTFVTSEDSRLAVSLRREMELWHRPPITAISVLKFCRALSFCSNGYRWKKKNYESYPYILSMNAWQHWVAYILFPVKSICKQQLCNSSPKPFPNTGTLLSMAHLYQISSLSHHLTHLLISKVFSLGCLVRTLMFVWLKAGQHTKHMWCNFLWANTLCSDILTVSCLNGMSW